MRPKVCLAVGMAAAVGIAGVCMAQPSELNFGVSDAVGKAVVAFGKGYRGSYIKPNARLADQLGEGLSGPTDPVVGLPGGYRLVSACRLHSCDEKGAVILSHEGVVEAGALIHFGCHYVGSPVSREGERRPRRKVDCADKAMLTVFMRKGPRADELDRAMRDWAFAREHEAIPHEIVWLR